jgi:microcin C transport system ATP-binding protein
MTQPEASPLLSIEQLSICFGDQRVVDRVSFEIRPAEKLGLVGESGSGKSVTALSILRLVESARYEGVIRFQSQDLLQYGPRQMQAVRGREIAMIFQEPMTSLNPLYTIGDQVAEVMTTHEAMGARAARARAVELLEKTGIAEPARRASCFPHQLSGGQRQRAMIAMALACRPKLLIADEPTTALDVTVQAQVLELLDELQREFGMALLFITHDLNLARRFTTRVGVMERGVLVEIGTAVDVLTRPSHPYTRRLVDSRPRRNLDKLADDRAVVLAADRLRVEFAVRTPGHLRRQRFKAVDETSLTLARGETLGIVGESGSGKTTLAMALIALQPLAAGEVRLDGARVDDAGRRALVALRRRIQVVFQDPFASLSPRRTVEQIVGEGLEVHAPELDRVARRAAVVAMLAEVGLDESDVPGLLARYPHEFSGGQRQRIAVARAMIVRPEVLVLDEPTSALDATVQRQVLSLLTRLQKSHGTSFLFISHDLAVIRAMSHRIMVMKDGMVIEQAETEELFRRPQTDYTRALMRAAALADESSGGGPTGEVAFISPVK